MRLRFEIYDGQDIESVLDFLNVLDNNGRVMLLSYLLFFIFDLEFPEILELSN